jgi:hypothetical protein
MHSMPTVINLHLAVIHAIEIKVLVRHDRRSGLLHLRSIATYFHRLFRIVMGNAF